ncbi:hypothetical protein CBQ26_09215 [Deinococcus indicus]|uniref:Uncharacterized protein n=1 Tax=Deinococcus indicus TaxID=223556 RepID=A0A2D0A821_9DEIO|nr:hypothetical protein [Deinococcus indicus]OWL96546.1 hypothetical protein CBQ26_09215 [Deinococcus indicus]
MTDSRTHTENTMVEHLAPAMKAKLARAREKGRGGWEHPEECSIEHLYDCLLEHVAKPNLDMVDVANIAGMIGWRLEHHPQERLRLQTYQAHLWCPVTTPQDAPGYINYSAYRSRLGGLTWDGRPMPEWTDLPQNVRDGWEAGGRMVRRHALVQVQQFLEREHAAMNRGRW